MLRERYPPCEIQESNARVGAVRERHMPAVPVIDVRRREVQAKTEDDVNGAGDERPSRERGPGWTPIREHPAGGKLQRSEQATQQDQRNGDAVVRAELR